MGQEINVPVHIGMKNNLPSLEVRSCMMKSLLSVYALKNGIFQISWGYFNMGRGEVALLFSDYNTNTSLIFSRKTWAGNAATFSKLSVWSTGGEKCRKTLELSFRWLHPCSFLGSLAIAFFWGCFSTSQNVARINWLCFQVVLDSSLKQSRALGLHRHAMIFTPSPSIPY